jgi:CP family cyanate transporter-like MFS transporter
MRDPRSPVSGIGQSSAPAPDASGSLNWPGLILLWLAGASLRITLLAIPPVLPLIHEDLQLSQGAVGALSGLPVLIFAFGAISGSLLLSRVGALRAIYTGLLLTALGGALRGVGPDPTILFTMTFVMGLGVAIMQPVMPVLVREWLPHRVGLATAVYVNGLLCGEIASAALTLPLILPLLDRSWELSLAFWSLPVVFTITLFAIAQAVGKIAVPQALPRVRLRWWPDWRDRRMWRVGLILGCFTSMYFTSNAFLPDYLNQVMARPDLISPALTSLNVGQIPASAILITSADYFVGKRSSYIVTGILAAGSVVALLLTSSGAWVVFWAGAIGFLAGFALILTLSLPALLTSKGDVHRFAAGVFVIGYAMAFLTPVISGTLWDLTELAGFAFAPLIVAGLLMAALATKLSISPSGDPQKP